MERNKLLYISETMVSGVLSCVSGLCGGLADDFDITVAYGLRPDTPADLSKYFDPRVRLIPVESFTRSISPKKDPAALRALKKIAKEVQPDIIHLHSSKAGVLGRLAFAWSRTPVFYTPHGYSFLMTDSSAAKRKLYKAIETVCAHTGAHTISCSPGEDRETRKMTRKAYTVCNGIDSDALDAAAASVERTEHPFTVFMLGRISTPRNPGGFNEIALRLPDVQFLWIGDGELRDQLTAPNIRITGWVDRTEAIRLAVNSDAFLLPSLWEGLPMSLLEAMCLEKPCMVSNVIGNRDVIRNGENGFLCNCIEDYVEAVRRIRLGEAQELARQARTDVLSSYNTRVQCEGYRRIYLDALKERKC